MIEVSVHYAGISKDRISHIAGLSHSADILKKESLSFLDSYSELPYDMFFDLRMNSVRVLYIQPFFNFLLWYYYDTEAIHKLVQTRLYETASNPPPAIPLEPATPQRVQYHINILNPYILVPVHPSASQGVILDLGRIELSNSFFAKADQTCLLPIFIADRVHPTEGEKTKHHEEEGGVKPIYFTKVSDASEYDTEGIPNVQMVEEIFVSMSDMNMKSFTSDAFERGSTVSLGQSVDASGSARKQRRLISKSAREVQQLANSIISDTRMSLIVQWPYGPVDKFPSQPWSKYVIHVPQLIFKVTEEQCETLYRMIEFNICSNANYYIGHNEALPPLMVKDKRWKRKQVGKKGPLTDSRLLIGTSRNPDSFSVQSGESFIDGTSSDVGERRMTGPVLAEGLSEKEFVTDGDNGIAENLSELSIEPLQFPEGENEKVLAVVPKMKYTNYSMILQLDQLYFGFRHNDDDAAHRRASHESYEKKMEQLKELDTKSFISSVQISDSKRLDIIARERELFETKPPLDLKFMSVVFDAHDILIFYHCFNDSSLDGDFTIRTISLMDKSGTENKFTEILTPQRENQGLDSIEVASEASPNHQIVITYRKLHEFAKQDWIVDMHQIYAFLIPELFWSVMGFQMTFINESLKYFYMWKSWRDPNNGASRSQVIEVKEDMKNDESK
jgi:hypothetical protein